jgi:hypothetical protein
MGVTMPFSQFRGSIQLSEAMSEAFRRVCDVLRLNGDAEDSITELVITKIVERANAGESDPERLCIEVLAELEPQGVEYDGVTPREIESRSQSRK